MRQVVAFVPTAVAVALSAACASMEFAAPDAESEAALRIADLTGEQGDLVCAAERVDLERSFQALKDNRAEQQGVARSSARWAEHEARAMNLSQASAQMSQALETAKNESEAARAGVPGSNLRAARALREFDVYANAAGRAGARPVRPGEPSAADESWKAAQYAAVWLAYFGSSEDSERQELLDWLQSRSGSHISTLRDYHEDFRAALRHACG